MAVELTEVSIVGQDMAALEKAFDVLRSKNIVRRIAGPEDMHELGFPDLKRVSMSSGQYLLISDIDSYLVADPASSSTTPRPPQDSGSWPWVLAAASADVPESGAVWRGREAKHVILPHARNFDIAPTIARLLGLQLGPVSGKALAGGLIP